MEEQYFYSASKNAFFPLSFKDAYQNGIGWPNDAKEVPVDVFIEYAGNKQGFVREPDKHGMPTWAAYEEKESHESKKSRLIGEADAVIQPLLGYAVSGILSDTEKETFKAWNEYRKALEDIDVTVTDIKWPTKPE